MQERQKRTSLEEKQINRRELRITSKVVPQQLGAFRYPALLALPFNDHGLSKVLPEL